MKQINLEIEKPKIFPNDKIIAGVTKKNLSSFEPYGFSIIPAKIITESEASENQKIFADFIGIPLNNLKFQHQTHGIIIRQIDENSVLEDSDGMFTNIKNIVLAVKIADCSAILVYDPINEAICAFHSGWRGTKQNIARHGIEKMNIDFGTEPDNLLVYLSPSASGKNYEVGWEVAQFFPDFITETGNGKYFFDNKAQIKQQLIDVGVKDSNIEISEICTIENTDYHSFRRDGVYSGRMAAYIGIKELKN